MEKRVALYGGSFNPPHLGHAQVVLHLLHAGFDEVWAIPVASHPFGKELASFEHRLRMLQLALEDFGSRVRVCDVEATLPAPSWTVNTVEHLVARHPECRFSLALGEDQRQLDSWHRIEDLRRLVPFVFVRRGIWRFGDPVPSVPDYSSAEIRRRLAAGQMPEGWMHARVCAYIRRENLYGFAPAVCPDFAIIGLGRVGGSLFSSLRLAGFRPRWCADPDPERREIARREGILVFSDWREGWCAHPVAGLIFCTPDSWKPAADPSFWDSGKPLCLHAGGMHDPLDVFGGMALAPENLGILHPVLAVPSADVDLRGRLFSVTGNTQQSVFSFLLGALSADVLPIAGKDRALFHGLCALLSNGTQVLEQKTAFLLQTLGVPPELAARWVRRLVEGGLSAWLERGDAGLTGPWVRGDMATIKLHMNSLLESAPWLMALYRELCELASGGCFGPMGNRDRGTKDGAPKAQVEKPDFS